MPTNDPCAEARSAMGTFLATGLSGASGGERQERMRAHLDECEECAQEYQDLGRGVASIRGARERQDEIDGRRRSNPGARGMGALGVFYAMNRQAPSNRAMRLIWSLRPLLIAGFFIFLMREMSKPPGPAPRFDVIWLEGTSQVMGKPMEKAGPTLGMHRGSNVITGPDGRVDVVHGETHFRLEPGTGLLVERVMGHRVRLVRGAMVAEGAFDVGVGPAMVHSDGDAVLDLRMEDGLVRVQVLEGEVEVVTRGFEEQIEAPGLVLIDSFGERVP